tara:strand:+ start:14222 stop:14917 length:696 start_codon:yes stop_codon:yes gene_type:complete
MRVNIAINVESDGSGTYSGEFAISKAFSETFSEEEQDLSCDELFEDDTFEVGPLSDLPLDTEIALFEDDDWCGYNFTASFSDFGVGVEEEEGFPISENEGIVTFRIPANELFRDATEGLDQGGDEDIDSAMLLKAFGIPDPEFTISVTIDGETIEHNANTVNGSTLIWKLDILNPEPNLEPYAIVDTTTSDSGSSGAPIAIIVVATLASLTLLGFLQKRLTIERVDKESTI